MPVTEFPLLDLFTRLQKAGLPLGLGEYQLALKAMQSGFGVKDGAELKRLCSTLWVKSEDDQHIFEYHFEALLNSSMGTGTAGIGEGSVGTEIDGATATSNQSVISILRWVAAGSLLLGILFLCIFIANFLKEDVEPADNNAALPIPQATPAPPSEVPPEELTEEEIEPLNLSLLWVGGLLLLMASVCFLGLRFASRVFSSASDANDPSSIESIRTEQKTIELDDEVELAQVREAESGQRSSARLRTSGAEEFFPITQRQLKQGWRYLRRPVREGAKTELDIDATVQQVGNKGMLLEPVMIPRRTNRTELLLLIDQGGSMVPFQLLSQRLIETASRSGKLGNTQPFFFHNCFDEYLYTDPVMCEAVPTCEVWSHLSRRTVALIFSDAGAARGRRNRRRLAMTQNSVMQLRQYVRHITWLNPMPQGRWGQTTAACIAEIVPMFGIDRQGFQHAIDVLRGR
ncbi:MAG: hypothetical protein AAGD25_14940 [Cyanobacteria bacterium P01_F01_bin.150]